MESPKFVSFISDATTDSSITEAEIVFIRYAIGRVNVMKADAVTLKKAVIDCEEKYLDIQWQDLVKKLVGFGSDGAAVMLGKNNGVVAQLKKDQLCLQAVHCYAHRLELAYKDALKRVDLYKKLSALLLGLYLFYHGSSKNRSQLRGIAATHNITGIVPTCVGGTRWLPHLQESLQRLLKGYRAIMGHL